jgi:ribosomal protein S6
MKIYELSYLISLEVPEDQVKTLQEKVNNIILEMKGTMDRVEDASKRRLGSQKRGQNMAYMATLNFFLAPEKLNDLKEKLKGEPQILNFIVIHKKPFIVKESKRKPRILRPESSAEPSAIPTKTTEKPKKVEIKEIEKKLEEILGE